MALTAHWYRRSLSIVTAPLVPLSLIFKWNATRRSKTRNLNPEVPAVVIAIGNITVGGTGKTPLTLFLAQALQARGLRIGVISRGYPASPLQPIVVTPDLPASRVGDEPLLYAGAGVTTCVCASRNAALAKLLEIAPHTQVVLADDALQHYRLARDIEIAVVDGTRGFGNGYHLPAGPLREAPQRLGDVHACVINGGDGAFNTFAPNGIPVFYMSVNIVELTSLDGRSVGLGDAPRVSLCAAIGHPKRFFEAFRAFAPSAQIVSTHQFPDHGQLDLAGVAALEGQTIVVTQKDAVKLQHLQGPLRERVVVARACAQVRPDLVEFALGKIDEISVRRGLKIA